MVDGVDSVECRELHLLLAFLDKLLCVASPQVARDSLPDAEAPSDEVPSGDESLSPPLAGSTLGLGLLITTRYLSNLQGRLLHPHFHVQLTQERVEPDIRAFVEGHIYGMDEESRNAMGPDLQQDVARRIVEASDGL